MNNDTRSLCDKVVLVTGASRGIGQAILQIFAQQGAIVVGTATTETGAQQIENYLNSINCQGSGMVLDVGDDASVAALITAIKSKHAAVDILVNNAGITQDNLLLRMNFQQWQSVINTNLNGVYRLCHAVLRDMMKSRYGRIINISSVVALTGNGGQSNYAAAKAGIIAFSKSLAKEVGSRGISVNCIAPGFITTDMTAALAPQQRDKLLASIPMARLGTAQDIAEAALFLALSSYISGETINVNGGMAMI